MRKLHGPGWSYLGVLTGPNTVTQAACLRRSAVSIAPGGFKLKRGSVTVAVTLLALALPIEGAIAAAPSAGSKTVTTTSVSPTGGLVTTTVTKPPPMVVDGGGGGGGYSCADASRTSYDGWSATTVGVWIHACFDGRGHLVTSSTSGDHWVSVGCCEPFVHGSGWENAGFTNDGSVAHSWGTYAVEGRVFAVVGMLTWTVTHPGASISVNGWGTIGG